MVVDLSGSDDRLPDHDLKHLLRELKSYNTDLLRKPMLIFGNKNDLEGKAVLPHSISNDLAAHSHQTK
jgi:GTPase involved in cell partitioning and DNA repair